MKIINEIWRKRILMIISKGTHNGKTNDRLENLKLFMLQFISFKMGSFTNTRKQLICNSIFFLGFPNLMFGICIEVALNLNASIAKLIFSFAIVL